MPYVRTTWSNREVENPRTYTLQDNGDGTTTLVPAEGNVISTGTPITATNMNNIEEYLVLLGGLTEIIEKGQNSNGNYIRWANGWLLCFGWFQDTVTTGTYGNGNAFSMASRTFPYAFSHTTYFVGCTPYFNEASGMDVTTTTTTYFSPRVYTGVALTSAVRQFGYIALGRWKEG